MCVDPANCGGGCSECAAAAVRNPDQCVECWLEREVECVPGSYPEKCVVCAATVDERLRIAKLALCEASRYVPGAARGALISFADDVRGGKR